MCGTCGCGHTDEPVKILKPGEKEHSHSYSHIHDHEHEHDFHHHNHEHAYTHTHDFENSNHQHDHADNHHNHSHDHKHHHDDDDCCDDCGCDHNHEPAHEHHHDNAEDCCGDCNCDHEHEHHHDHHNHDHTHVGRQIKIELDALQKNDFTAARNRGYFEGKGLLALNLVSSPGSGKTSLLEKTIKSLKGKVNIYVIEGDQQTMNDANRIHEAGAPVVQINTGNGCHLDAEMVNRAIKRLDIKEKGILMIENVGNLVCPSLFDLGEDKRVVIISVTEGDDKPLKYPTMFETSDICIINKTDLLPYVDFDVAQAKAYALRVNPKLRFFELSVKTEEGFGDWTDWLLSNI